MIRPTSRPDVKRTAIKATSESGSLPLSRILPNLATMTADVISVRAIVMESIKLIATVPLLRPLEGMPPMMYHLCQFVLHRLLCLINRLMGTQLRELNFVV